MNIEYPIQSAICTPWDTPDKLLSLLLDPLVALDSDSISDTAGTVTEWANNAGGAGTGGTSYDLDSVGGAPLIELQQGHRVVRFDGINDYLRPVAEIVISQPFTVLAVAKNDDVTTAFRFLFNSRNNFNSINASVSSVSTFRLSGGSNIDVTARDGDVNAHMGVVNGASSSYTVFNTVEGTDTGNLTNPLRYITLASDRVGSSIWDGWIGSFIIYGRVLSAQEISQATNAEKDKWVLGSN